LLNYWDTTRGLLHNLVTLFDKKNLNGTPKDSDKEAFLVRDEKEYKPIRNALMHTALLTDSAKTKLTSVYENIKGRIINLLFDDG